MKNKTNEDLAHKLGRALEEKDERKVNAIIEEMHRRDEESYTELNKKRS